MTPITNCMRQGGFHWTLTVIRELQEIKFKMTKALVLRHPDFFKVFEVAYDASGVGIEAVLSQEGHLIAFIF